MPTADKMVAGATLDVFGQRTGALGGVTSIASLGYLPRSVIYLPDGRVRFKSPFSYVAQFTGAQILTHAKTVTVPIQILPDSDFVAISKSITCVGTDLTTYTALANMPFTINAVDTGSGVSLMSAQMDVQNFFGETGSPRVNLGIPYIFRRNGTIQVTLTNNHGATDFNVEVAFEGFKVFDIPAE